MNASQSKGSAPALQQLAAAIVATGFTAIILIFGVLLISAVEQIHDILLQVDRSDAIGPRVGFVLAGIWFSLMCWWSARFVFDAMANLTGEPGKPPLATNLLQVVPPAEGISSGSARWLPRVYALVLPLVVFIYCLREALWLLLVLDLLVVAPVALLLVKRRQLLVRLKKQAVFGANRMPALLVQPAFWTSLAMALNGAVAVWALASPFQLGALFGAYFVVFWGLGSILFTLTFLVCWALPALLNWLLAGWLRQHPSWRKTCNWLINPPHPVLVVVLVVAIAISFITNTDNHLVRREAVTRADDYAFASFDAAWGQFQEQLLQQGLSTQAGSSRKYPVFFVASQGGGLRAAYWSARGLAEMEAAIPGISHNIFTLAGVSGGSVGNSFYAASLFEQSGALAESCAALAVDRQATCRIGHAVGQDYLSPVLTSFLYNDLLYRFLPVASWNFLARDRAAVLEQSWEQGFRAVYDSGAMAGFFQGLYRQQDQWRPLVLSMGSHQESGTRLITAPFPVEPEIFTNQYDTYQLMGCSDGRHLSCDMRLSTAALTSARFPYVTPAGTLAMKKSWSEKDHIIDGGYVENYGLLATRAIIDYLRAQGKLTLAGEEGAIELVPVIIIFANDMALELKAFNPERSAPYLNTGSMIFNELTNPLQGLAATRVGRSVQSLTETIALQQSGTEQSHLFDFYYQADATAAAPLLLKDVALFRLQADANPVRVPLGWWLSSESQAYMAKQYTTPGTEAYQVIAKLHQQLLGE
ncbi:hypothetical protein [Halioxenophilus sp. WMMB6]|uniref:hypothetical protein n=1 Tax=Halioxenophilus sp. WMMB6 TaxID=3073815 RepID=UPI00295EE5E3|nr:hypothetical protein [Halioxenophilus sp. WMMB6]